MTKEFILNTLLPYKLDLSTCGWNEEETTCCYQTKTGNRCAIGKHLIDGPHLNYTGGVKALNREYDLDKILTQEALEQHIPLNVWEYMQLYHDHIAFKMEPSTINSTVINLEKETGFLFPELKFT